MHTLASPASGWQTRSDRFLMAAGGAAFRYQTQFEVSAFGSSQRWDTCLLWIQGANYLATINVFRTEVEMEAGRMVRQSYHLASYNLISLMPHPLADCSFPI